MSFSPNGEFFAMISGAKLYIYKVDMHPKERDPNTGVSRYGRDICSLIDKVGLSQNSETNKRYYIRL